MVSFTNYRLIHRRSMKPLQKIENSFDTQVDSCTTKIIVTSMAGSFSSYNMCVLLSDLVHSMTTGRHERNYLPCSCVASECQ